MLLKYFKIDIPKILRIFLLPNKAHAWHVLILADIRLNGVVSGREVIQYVRDSELNVGTPLIVWSAFVNKNNEEKYLAWDADFIKRFAPTYAFSGPLALSVVNAGSCFCKDSFI